MQCLFAILEKKRNRNIYIEKYLIVLDKVRYSTSKREKIKKQEHKSLGVRENQEIIVVSLLKSENKHR